MPEQKRRALKVEDDLWRRFKLTCVARDKELNERMIELITADVERYETEKGASRE